MTKTLGECLLERKISGLVFSDINNPRESETVKIGYHIYRVESVGILSQGKNGVDGALKVYYMTMDSKQARQILMLNGHLKDVLDEQ